MFSSLVDDYFFKLFDISLWIFDAVAAILVELQIDTGRLLLLVNITCSGCSFLPLVPGLREFTVLINAGGTSFSYRDGCSTGFALFLKAARSAMIPLSNTGLSVRLTKKGWSWGLGSAASGFLSEAELRLASENLGGVLILYLSATSSKSLISSSKSKIAFSCCIASFLALKKCSLMSFSFYFCFSIFWTISGS